MDQTQKGEFKRNVRFLHCSLKNNYKNSRNKYPSVGEQVNKLITNSQDRNYSSENEQELQMSTDACLL